MNITFEKKFTNKELDEFIDGIYRNVESNPHDNYVFDLREAEHIGNQELLVLSALFRSFVNSKIRFKVEFFSPGVPFSQIDKRVKQQIIQFWDVWQIWRIVPVDECQDYFGITENFVKALKKDISYYPKQSEIFNRYGVTPFVTLSYFNNYNENEVQKLIDPIYRLNFAIEDLLKIGKCYHPFTSKSLSTIVTEELYLNFLDHSEQSSFANFSQMAFMSISFHSKLEKKTDEEIQKIKRLNFKTECLEETINFFYDRERKKYKNVPYIEFSFLDFGSGIPNTLKEQFLKENKPQSLNGLDSNILKYSFNYYSSRHPIYNKNNKIDKFIPRGLFDALTIVQRYKGLLIVRSNFGKVLFDFSVESNLEKAFSFFGNNNLFFPGTLITLYIPAIEDDTQIDTSSIKPEIEYASVKPEKKKYININTVVEKLNVPKEELYYRLIQELKNEIVYDDEPSLLFLSFKGCNIDNRLIKKTIYFLLTNYEINYRNNIVILNSPSENILDDIAAEILNLNTAYRNYKLHPLPIIDLDENNADLKIRWLGIYNNDDKEVLNNLLFEQYSVARSDFNEPANITGHLNSFDSFGNLISNFPNKANIIEFYRLENDFINSKQIKDLLLKHECIKNDDKANLYLCSGNYYQKEYIELNNLINDKTDCKLISNLLYKKLESEIVNIKNYNFISITGISEKILKSLESQNLIFPEQYTSTENYYTFDTDLSEDNIDPTKDYILICHVISSGYMTERLNARLEKLGTSIKYIAVITSILDENWDVTESFLDKYKDKILSLYDYPISKFTRLQIGEELFKKKTIRINPHTNIPIRLSIKQTNYNESVIFRSKVRYAERHNKIILQNDFLDIIDEDVILVGFLKFNSLIHPYFFKTEKILQNLQDGFFKETFNALSKKKFNKEKIQVFYPRNSGINFLDFGKLKSTLKDLLIEEIEIERFITPEGWRFPHNTDYISDKVKNNICLILDDGSCSGDSLIQMIDEISFYDAKEIYLFCIIGRVNDHKREFFSRLSQIKVKDGKSIPISIYFVCHWHIPTYYLDENPNTRETAWLNAIITLQNTPQVIKRIATNVLKEIKPKNIDNFKDYKYLPKTKHSDKIPKKELFLVREELGKVIGYRLYKESFKFFDFFTRKYEKQVLPVDRYKEIELLCATFIYEPYLYDKIVGVLPDVVETIENFVRVLIFSDSSEALYNRLTYKWNKKDLLHLFFIVFKDKNLIEELTKDILNQSERSEKEIFIEKFKKLLKFAEQADSNINYILYKLLTYFPLNSEQFNEKRFDTQLKGFIIDLIEEPTISNKEIKKYYNFITSLPSREKFEPQLGNLVANYNRQETDEYHLEKKSFDNNISNIVAAIRDCIYRVENSKPLLKALIDSIREKWFAILDFVIPILTFSSSFPDYLIPYSYFNLIATIENGKDSVRELVGFNEKVIFSLTEDYNEKEYLLQLEKNILKIQLALQIDSTFYQLIKERTSNLYELIHGVFDEIKNLGIQVTLSGEELISQNQTIMIPKLYAEKLLRNELVNNIKNHASKETDSTVLMHINIDDKSEIILTITNKKAEKEHDKSNLEGIKCLKLMTDSNLFYFDFKISKKEGNFIQKLIFKRQKNGH